MSDARLRALERRVLQTGSVEDEAAWLTERVRAGDLARKRLKLAADCGHPPACAALDRALPEPLGWREVRHVLRHATCAAAIRVAAVAASLAFDAQPRAMSVPEVAQARAFLETWRARPDGRGAGRSNADVLHRIWVMARRAEAAKAPGRRIHPGSGHFTVAGMTMLAAMGAGVAPAEVAEQARRTLIAWALEADSAGRSALGTGPTSSSSRARS